MVVKPISTQVSADTRPREDAHDERDEQSFDLLAYWRILAIRKWSILGLSLAITVLAALVVFSIKPSYRATVTLLIEASQLEILDTDFRTVLTDAISEQAEWNSFQVAPPLTAAQQTERTQAVNAFLTDRPRLTPDEQAERRRQLAASPFIFRQAKGTLDPFFASVAAVERAD